MNEWTISSSRERIGVSGGYIGTRRRRGENEMERDGAVCSHRSAHAFLSYFPATAHSQGYKRTTSRAAASLCYTLLYICPRYHGIYLLLLVLYV